MLKHVILDPCTRPSTLTAGSHYVPSGCPSQNYKANLKITAGLDCRLAEWIIDADGLVILFFRADEVRIARIPAHVSSADQPN